MEGRQQQKEKAKPYFGGIPYGPQVNRLKDKFPKPEEGTVFTHGELEGIISEPIGTQRYYGVVNSWRTYLLHDLGIDSAWLPGEGLKILNPAERLKVGEDQFRQGLRKTRRAFRRTAIIPRERLDDLGRQRFDHQMKVMAKLSTAAVEAGRGLAIDLAPVKSLPKAGGNQES